MLDDAALGLARRVGAPRDPAQNWRITQTTAAYTIASGPKPTVNALDMIVLATLSRMAMSDVRRRARGPRVRDPDRIPGRFLGSAPGPFCVCSPLRHAAHIRLTKTLLENPGATIDSVVADIFAKYPVPPAGGRPQ